MSSQTKLTRAARDRDCQIRLPGVCNGDPATTVLAHYRLSGTCGMGMKPHDLQGAWACSACHDACDGRGGSVNRDEVRLAHAEGVFRTQAILLKEGKVAA
ncbi:MAG: DUF1364 domain-containing protein [Pseudomonadaceae bacterium]|nr:DUF1364 domain-containing protein [Pseudomonadaceae bacterium]